MSGVGKAVSGILGGKTPSFDSAQAAASQRETARNQALYGQYGVDSSLGGIKLVESPGGGFTKKFTESAADIQRNKLIGQGLGGLSMDPSRAEESYYGRATRQLLPQLEQDRESLEQSLANRGIMTGTEQYNREMQRFERAKQDTLADITDKSVFSGQQLLGSQIGNIGSLAGQRDVGTLAGMGGGTGASFKDTYADQLAGDQARQKGREQMLAAGIGAGQMALSTLPFFAASDIRLKENLKVVGKLDNGLNVYVGNYKDFTGLPTIPQLFLIAQEVQEVNPDAVIEDNGYLKVNYKEAIK